jgi:hypothetical protein
MESGYKAKEGRVIFSEDFSKFDEISEEAENALGENWLLTEIVGKIMSRIKNLLNERRHKIKASIYEDIEAPGWKEFTITVEVETEEFDEILELWDVIEGEVENEVREEKAVYGENISEIEKINENLAIILDEL